MAFTERPNSPLIPSPIPKTKSTWSRRILGQSAGEGNFHQFRTREECMSPFSYAKRRLHSRHHAKPVSGTRIAGVFALFICFLAIGLWIVSKPQPVQGISSTIVISQVYGGGGNTGATFRNDFIELFNRGNTTVNVTGWSVQYASAAGTSWTNITNLSGSIPAGGYYLVQQASGGAVGALLPTPDATGTINLSATTGKVALVK